MGTIATIAAVVLTISFLTFVAFFGRLPVFRHTPISWLHRLLFSHIPGGVLALDKRLTNGKFSSSLMRCGDFMMNEKHPTVLIFFIGLLAGSEYIAIPTAWPLLSTVQRTTLLVVAAFPYVFLYLAASTDPGTVSLGNLQHHMLQYPYDYALFHPGARCQTCNLLKPPRSKHCSLCKRCIGRLDHHCVFINNCVGANNHRWFLLLLASVGVLGLYGGSLGLGLVSGRIREQYPTFSLLPWRAHEAAPDPTRPLPLHVWLTLLSWGLKDLVQVGSVGLLALLTSPLVWGLLAYNLWNVFVGQTTNESLKWSDWRYDMRDGFVFRRRLSHGQAVAQAAAAAAGAGVATVTTSATSLSRWPAEAQHVLIHSENGVVPPVEGAGLDGFGPWEQIWRLRDIDNLYDIGFWNGLKDIFVPGCQFHSRDLPSTEMRGRPRKRTSRS